MKKYLILLPLLALLSFYAINRENQKTFPQEASVSVHAISAFYMRALFCRWSSSLPCLQASSG